MRKLFLVLTSFIILAMVIGCSGSSITMDDLKMLYPFFRDTKLQCSLDGNEVKCFDKRDKSNVVFYLNEKNIITKVVLKLKKGADVTITEKGKILKLIDEANSDYYRRKNTRRLF
ncbi:hypothetical protein DEFDS_P075 (plasmid) [Deferribacter desulfuricans SSM1]|uniref:Lipoprotein n=1 Tax=Deferribacter desulfuricans (strain DSM 14783 / JCM 11476 / NBRC 101012 / SSM1) TaxID=639282 RepID=D3PEQ7_DEFDS|nr:hypothetical protein [Deferribacter desulfuricans]BAI81699.1 hypothetical protein DEFDS_P075 [Deferribacter desulfuricans SSM1]